MRAMLRGGCRRGMKSGFIIGGAGQRMPEKSLHMGIEAGKRKDVRAEKQRIMAETEEMQAEKTG